MTPDERLRIATSDEPQTWDTALPNLSPADPGDHTDPWPAVPLGDLPVGAYADVDGKCRWCCEDIDPDGRSFYCSRTCEMAARADSNDDRPVP